ncbi:MAG: hypothetical protein AAFV59_02860 [Pseudomonadota bacterium]
MNFRFNDELLLSEADRDLAKTSYPNVYFALDHPDLRDTFRKIDRRANRSKKVSRWVGLAALVFATLSLLTFPFALLLDSVVTPTVSQSSTDQPISNTLFLTLGILGATFGLFALIFGNLGLGFGRVKRTWLQKRLIAERLRQWHAQYLISHAVEIARVASSPEDQTTWLETRAIAFARFQRNFIDQIGSEYTKYTDASAAAYSGQSIIDPTESDEFWIDPDWTKAASTRPKDVDPSALKELFEALEETRLRGQIQYTNYVLSSDAKFWSSPAKQLHILGNLSYILVLLAFVSNLVALIAAILVGVGVKGFPFDWEIMSSLAIAGAIVAVGARAMLEGLRPQRETRRMQFYAAALNHARKSLAKARTHNKQIEAFCLLERASFDEMIEFLSSNERARFIL